MPRLGGISSNAEVAQSGVNNVTGAGGTTTIVATDFYVFVDTSANSETINLPASPNTGEEHTVRRDGANNVIVSGNGNNVQEGTSSAASFTLTSDSQRVTFVYDGTIWRAVD